MTKMTPEQLMQLLMGEPEIKTEFNPEADPQPPKPPSIDNDRPGGPELSAKVKREIGIFEIGLGMCIEHYSKMVTGESRVDVKYALTTALLDALATEITTDTFLHAMAYGMEEGVSRANQLIEGSQLYIEGSVNEGMTKLVNDPQAVAQTKAFLELKRNKP